MGYIHKGLNGQCTDSTTVRLRDAAGCHNGCCGGVGVKVTGRSRVGCRESVSGLAGGVHGNWVREVRRCCSM